VLLALLAVTGCTAQHRPGGELAVSPAPREIIAVEVTNTFDRSVDVYYSSQFLGTLAPAAHARYPVAPTTARMPLYARFGNDIQRTFNISNGQMVGYVYGDPAPARR
jgi:hypothetical protein